MNNIFNMDNAFFTFLSKVCDVLILSVIYAIVCIPLITIGPATTALYYATVKVIRRERGYLLREFFKSFRVNFKRAAIVGIVLTIIFAILIIDLMVTWTSKGGNSSLNSVLIGIYMAITILILSFTLYVFPVLSRFDMNIKQLVKAASFMSIKHILYTLLMIVIFAASLVAIVFMPVSVVFIPVSTTLLISLLMERVFKKYMPKMEETDENTGKDEWYME